MNFAESTRGSSARRAALALLALCALASAAPSAAPAQAAPGALSPRLAELAKPEVRAATPAAQAARLDLAPSGPGSLLRDGNRVLAGVRFERGAANAVEALRAAGAEVVDVSGQYQTVTVAARPADLPALGTIAGVAGVTEILTPMARGADCGGLVRSEGDTQLAAAAARANWGVDGTGVTVGILSDSFDRDAGAVTHAANDVASGDLPGTGSPCGSTSPVGVLGDPESEGADEGRGMAQIVHDLAPGAAIDFATAFDGELAFAASIRSLAGAGAKVIADDVGYFEEPFFQDGPVAVAINEVSAAGVSYFTAAGNDNVVSGGHDVGSLEAPFADAGSCPAGVPAGEGTDCADFDPGPGSDDDYDMTVAPGGEVQLDLQWAEPWNGVGTDLDAYLLDGAGKVLAKSTSRNITSSQRPYEILQWENKGKVSAAVELAIPRFAGSGTPQFKFIQLGNGSNDVAPTIAQYDSSSAGDTIGPTIYGHSAAAGAITVAAVPFSDSAEAEPYSSRGPAAHRFGPVTGAAAAASTGTVTIAKPDLAATDCGVTTFFARRDKSGAWRFCGTSAAAPHAAAVAALIRQANPAASAAQVRADLLASARPVGALGPDVVGAGLVDADTAVNALALAPTVAITAAPQPLSRNRRPTIQFLANRPVAFSCSLDGEAPQPCASPYAVPRDLGDGSHAFAVTGTDLAGRVGNSGVASFTIDTRPPRTTIVKHPPKLIRSRHRRAKAVFRFRSSEAGSSFVCKVDRRLPRFCARRFVIRPEAGRHTIRVRARDRAGNVDASAAVFHFRVKRVG